MISALRITFFPATIVGYVDYPAALLIRGLAQGLADRGHVVRVVEPRQNHAVAHTLRVVGSGAVRQFHDDFPMVQHHTFEPRSGAPLLEWVTRELALIDIAVAVAGLDDEECRWLANVTRPGLHRLYLNYAPGTPTASDAQRLDLGLFDRIVGPERPPLELSWSRVPPCLAPADERAGLLARLDRSTRDALEPMAVAATALLGAAQHRPQ